MHPTTLAVILAASSAALAQDCQWQHVPAVPAGDFSSVFKDADGVSPTSVWAVGSTISFGSPSLNTRALIQRFDGERWLTIPHPLGPDDNTLDAIVVVSENEAYAFGSYVPPGPSTSSQPLFLIWNGASWDLGPSPTITLGGGDFHDAMMIEGQLWAFGRRARTDPPPAPGGYPLAARWDGSRWIEDPPSLKALHGQDSFNTIFGVDATGPDNIWAVGTAHQQRRSTGDPESFYTHYITHYDGSEWRVINDAPDPEPDFTSIHDVAVWGSHAWVVGYYSPGTGNMPYLAHFDGSTWTLEDLSWLPGAGAILRGVTALGPDDVYAAGQTVDSRGYPSPLILHFDGDAWSQMPVEPSDGENEQYYGIASIPGGEFWAVGSYFTPHDAPLSHRLACTPCRADLDGDGALTIFDFLEFQNLFDAGDPIADFDGDGDLTIFDFLAFQNEFDAGCP